MLGDLWHSVRDFFVARQDGLHTLAEIIKILGAVASFYALIKLRRIERAYLFKATMPALIAKMDVSLQALNGSLNDPDLHRIQIKTDLNHLLADVKTVKRRVKGDSSNAVKEFLDFLRPFGFEPHFWQGRARVDLSKNDLSEIYVRGRRLIRVLENELDDSAWSSR